MNEENEKSMIGIVSLWTGILGIVLPILCAFLAHLFAKENSGFYYLLCILLFIGLELVALITGIIGRKSLCGKAGMIIAIVCEVLLALLIILALPYFWMSKRSMTVTHPVVIEDSRTAPAPARPSP